MLGRSCGCGGCCGWVWALRRFRSARYLLQYLLQYLLWYLIQYLVRYLLLRATSCGVCDAVVMLSAPLSLVLAAASGGGPCDASGLLRYVLRYLLRYLLRYRLCYLLRYLLRYLIWYLLRYLLWYLLHL